MIIRKLFKIENAHLVRNCSTKRCSQSQHGHSSKIEVFLTADKLDYGQMIMDFSLFKEVISDVIDSFDHTYSAWYKESDEFLKYVIKFNDRYAILPISPSAESYSLMFLFIIDKILKSTVFVNGEENIRVSSVRYHETETGYAEAFVEDLKWVNYKLSDIVFSNGIINEWKNKETLIKFFKNEEVQFIHSTPEHQIEE